jgi:hypothetical protein
MQLRDTLKVLQGEGMGDFWVIMGEKLNIWVNYKK